MHANYLITNIYKWADDIFGLELLCSNPYQMETENRMVKDNLSFAQYHLQSCGSPAVTNGPQSSITWLNSSF